MDAPITSRALEPSKPPVQAKSARTRLALGALGVVFGDIGTSPLYAFKQCFLGEHAPPPTHANVLGILSLIVWSIVAVVCIKYVTFILRANHQGEGGTLALLALLRPTSKVGIPPAITALTLTILFGTAMLYGDGVITPAISVLSALEGLDVITKAAHPFILPVTVAILIGLFAAQRFGTEKIGGLFGPIMLLWFGSITVFGAIAIAADPRVLAALSPLPALEFVVRDGPRGIFVMGAVVLCVSGVEALYADLAHFGIGPMRIAWYAIVFPALIINYLGQGAMVLVAHGPLPDSTFFALVPQWALVPEVALATAATVIASQALISGAFSLTQQAVQLGYLPRFDVRHTSNEQQGQIYMPAVTAMLAIACIALVVTFKSSDKLGDAYGLAVTVTMLTTTVAYYALARGVWKWSYWRVLPLMAIFLAFDGSFLVGNIPKLPTGGWIPLVIAIVIFTFFVTWNDGRRKHAKALAGMEIPIPQFLQQMETVRPTAVTGTAVFLTAHPEGIPYALTHQWLRNHITFEVIVLMTIVTERRPFVDPADRINLDELRPGALYRVTAHYGFMEMPSVDEILARCADIEEDHHFREATYYLADPTIVPDPGPERLATWRRVLYAWMVRNARSLTASIGLRSSRVVRVGVEIPI